MTAYKLISVAVKMLRIENARCTHQFRDVADCGKVFGSVAFPPARRSLFVEDWGIQRAAIGCFGGWQEGHEFAVEPDCAMEVVD